MSMRNYGVADFGLVLSEKEIKEIAKVIFEDFSDEAWRGAKYEFIEVIFGKLKHFTRTLIPTACKGTEFYLIRTRISRFRR